jgi:hypothetical protein
LAIAAGFDLAADFTGRGIVLARAYRHLDRMDAVGGERQISHLIEIEVADRARGDVVGVAIDGGLVHGRLAGC